MPSFLETVKSRYGTPEPVATVHHLPARDFAGDISPYASSALNRELVNMANAIPGGRNHQLNKCAFSLSQLIAGGELPHQLVHDQLTQAALAAGLPAAEIAATLNSGLKAGTQHPRETPPPTPLPAVTTIQTPDTTPDTAAGLTEPEGINDRIQVNELTDADRQYLQALTRHRALTAEIDRQRTQREARRHLDDEDHLKQFRVPTYRDTLTEELLIPDDPINYTIDRLLPKGGNVLLTAQFKTGKTTFVNHLAKCLADSEPFLGEYDVSPLTGGRVGMFNYEVDDHQYRRWLRESNIQNTDAISVLNLRGYRLPAVIPRVEDWIVNWLQEHQIKVWVVDPFARAFVGSGNSENDNTEVGRFLDTLDVIKERAGVTDLILPTHTGRAEFEQGEERARGATRLDDWADVRWFLTKDDEDTRFFRGTGRDVEVPEQKLSFNEADRSLKIGGGDRAWEKKRAGENRVVDHVNANPGCSTRSIYAALRQAGLKGKDGVLQGHIDSAVYGNRIMLRQGETNGAANRYYPLGASVIGGVG